MHSAIAPTSGWTPRLYGSDLSAWLRADRGITLVSGAVSAWSDQSKNTRNFSQSTPGNRLGYSTSDAAFNNRPVLVGTGSGWLVGPAWTLAQPFTVLLVATAGTYADWRTFLDASSTPRGGLVRAEPANLLATYAGATNITSASIVSPSIIAAIFDGASSAHYVSSVTPGGLSSPGPDGFNTPLIGAGPGGIYPLQSVSKLAEIAIVKRALTLADIKRFQRYARGRYGLPVTGL
jgi:hypothetical protein